MKGIGRVVVTIAFLSTAVVAALAEAPGQAAIIELSGTFSILLGDPAPGSGAFSAPLRSLREIVSAVSATSTRARCRASSCDVYARTASLTSGIQPVPCSMRRQVATSFALRDGASSSRASAAARVEINLPTSARSS